MKNDINQKYSVVSGTVWSAVDSLASSGITFIVGIILARLLSPEEFGLVGLSTVFVNLLNSFVDCGFSSALIRKTHVSEVEYNTTFYFNLAVSILMFVVCICISPAIGIFFDNIELISVVRVLSIIIIFNAFGLIQRTIFIKNINFKVQAKISLISSLLSGVVGILLAINSYGIWSLVFQQVSRHIFTTILFWIFSSWRPQKLFSIIAFKDLFGFGSKLLVSGLIDTLCNELSTIVIGKVTDAKTLGNYSRAKSFSGIFSSNLSSIVLKVTYPTLSRYQEDEEKLVINYRKLVRVVMFCSSILMFILACSSKQLILVLLGSQWSSAILYLQLVCFIDLLYPLRVINLNILKVKGYSNYVLKLSIIKRIIEVIPIALCFIDIKYMLYGFIITGIIGFYLNSYYANKVINYSIKDQITDIIPSLLFAIIIGGCVLLVDIFVNDIYLSLIIKVCVGLSLAILICFYGKEETCANVREFLLKLKKNK